VVGALNDALRATFGNEAVRYSLLLVSLVGIVSAACYLQARAAWAATCAPRRAPAPAAS